VVSFVDTSALLPLVDIADPRRADVYRAVAEADAVRTHNYVVVEAEALVRRCLGAAASKELLELIADIADIGWVDRDLHDRAASRLEPRGRRASLVDEVSFAFMRDGSIGTAIALDDDFAEEGFAVLP